MNFLLSLFDVLKSVDKKKSDCNQNIILVLDEVDAYFHPKYQINLVDDLVRIVSEVLKDYYVQIIFTCNTPLELSDLPASNICYLENGKLLKENNEMPTFGSNVCNLLKNNFYINSTMGTFAKKKIDETIKFLTDRDDTCISQEEVRYIISIIGEPLIKDKLQNMYYKKYPNELPSEYDTVSFYKRTIQELQTHLTNGKKINIKDLEQLEEKLISLANTIKEVRK